MPLSSLDDQQEAAVQAQYGPVCVLAGAGTGKTRTITHRIAYLIKQGFVAPSQILAVTFTTKAAGELQARLRTMDVGNTVVADTFHKIAARQLRYFWPMAIGNRPWEFLQHIGQTVNKACRAAELTPNPTLVADLIAEIQWAKASLISPEDYPTQLGDRAVPLDPERVAAVYREYEELKFTSQRCAWLDYDDLILLTAGMLEDDQGVAAELQERYRCFFVDEYQDITPLQQRLLDAWLGQRDTLTVVGDSNQTIYSFAGATAQYLLGFSRKFPDATVVRLERDYRSTPQIVDLANHLLRTSMQRIPGTRLELQGQQPEGPAPLVCRFPDEQQEAMQVAAHIHEHIQQGMASSDIAVLYRVNAQSALYEQALAGYGVAYQVRGGKNFFDRPEIRQMVRKITQLAENPDITQRGQLLLPILKGLAEPLGLTTEEPAGFTARDRRAGLMALLDMIVALVTDNPQVNLAHLLALLQSQAMTGQSPDLPSVTLASLHAAKGLEWQSVYIVGLTEGTLPIQHAIDAGPATIEEEQRLLYVGITRAKRHLWLSYAKARSDGRTRKPSRFLAELRHKRSTVDLKST